MKRLLFTLPLLVILLFSLQTSPVYSDSTNIYLQPASGNVAKDGTLAVEIREDSGAAPVNAVQANLSYPTDLLSFVAVRSSDAFGINAQTVGGGGSVKLARGALPEVSGDQLVATVVFKVIGKGVAAVNFADGTSVLSSQSNSDILSSSRGGKYTLKVPERTTTPPPAPPPILSEDKLRLCEEHEQDIKTLMVRITDRGQKLFDMYTTVSTRTQAYYEENNLQLSSYDTLVGDVNTKKAAAQTSQEKLKDASLTFSCDNPDPKGSINNFKTALSSEINSLQSFKSSVKNLVTGVKSAGGER